MGEKKGGNGKKYLAGEVDFGILGKMQAYLFKNEKRDKNSNQPYYRLVIKEGDSWREVGAFWVKEVKQRDERDDLD